MGCDETICDVCNDATNEYDAHPMCIYSAEETKHRPKLIEELSVCEACYESFVKILIPATGDWADDYSYFETDAYHTDRAIFAEDRVKQATAELTKVQAAQKACLAIPKDRKRKLEPEAPKPKAKKQKRQKKNKAD
jgi:hypothetical protein